MVIKDKTYSKGKVTHIYKIKNICCGKKPSREIYIDMIKSIIKNKEII